MAPAPPRPPPASPPPRRPSPRLTDEGREGIAQDEGCEDGPPLLKERPRNGEQDDGQAQRHQLRARAHGSRQQRQVARRPEHVAVHQLPPALLAEVLRRQSHTPPQPQHTAATSVHV